MSTSTAPTSTQPASTQPADTVPRAAAAHESARLAREGQYHALLNGQLTTGQHGTVVFAVSSLDIARGAEDTVAAAGLALALHDRGYGVRLLPPPLWHLADGPADTLAHAPADGEPGAGAEPGTGTVVYVATVPRADPSLAPAGSWKLAWVRSGTDQWSATAHLAGYDQVVCSTELSLRRMRRLTARAHGVLPAGVDTALFTAPEPGTARQPYLAGDAGAADGPGGAGGPGYFDWPALYRGASLVVDDGEPADPGYGALSPRFFAAAACGALPVVSSRLGLAQLGLPAVPSYRTEAERRDQLAWYHAHEPERQAAAEQLCAQVHSEHSWQVRAGQFLAVLEQARHARQQGLSAPAPRHPVHFYPEPEGAIPYQRLLYGQLGELADAYPVRITVPLLTHLARQSAAPRPGITHLMWLSPVLQAAEGPFATYQQVQELRASLADFAAAGGRLLWTVHALAPHEDALPSLVQQLGQTLAERADVIHVSSRHVAGELTRRYQLDAGKIALIEQASYRGVFPDWLSPQAARRKLGVLAAEKVLIVPGPVPLGPELAMLLDAFDVLAAEDPTLRLLLPELAPQAGPGDGSADSAGSADGGAAGDGGAAAAALLARIAANVHVLCGRTALPADRVQLWFACADIAVLLPAEAFEAGAFLLAQSFGLPALVPHLSALDEYTLDEHAPGEYAPREHISVFTPGDPASLLAGLRTRLASLNFPARAQAERAAARELAQELPPARMSAQFAGLVAQLSHTGQLGRRFGQTAH